MQFCEDNDLDWSELFQDFSNIYEKYDNIEEVSPLQGIALARELSFAIDNFKDKLTQISIKQILCKVLEQIDIDADLQEITNEIANLFQKFNELDDAISAIDKDGYDSLEDLENAVKPIFDMFEDDKTQIKEIIKETLNTLFQPLIELGATQEQIDNALEDVELSSNPIELITDLFIEIAESTLNDAQ